MREAIKQRISRRRYSDAPVAPERVVCLQAQIDRLNQASGLTITLVDDASSAFSSMLKTYGMFSGVRSVFVLKGPQNDPYLAEKIGYYGEELVLFATKQGLGTCWVAGTFDRSKLIIPEGEAMLCVIPVGEVEAPSGKEKLIRGRVSANRKSAQERMTGYDSAPQWAKDAMEAVRLAPSAVNSQKPLFHWQDGRVTAEVEGYQPDAKGYALLNIIDLGIAKKHFEIVAGGIFALGQGAAFEKQS